jgi:hypothetical protein
MDKILTYGECQSLKINMFEFFNIMLLNTDDERIILFTDILNEIGVEKGYDMDNIIQFILNGNATDEATEITPEHFFYSISTFYKINPDCNIRRIIQNILDIIYRLLSHQDSKLINFSQRHLITMYDNFFNESIYKNGVLKKDWGVDDLVLMKNSVAKITRITNCYIEYDRYEYSTYPFNDAILTTYYSVFNKNTAIKMTSDKKQKLKFCNCARKLLNK